MQVKKSLNLKRKVFETLRGKITIVLHVEAISNNVCLSLLIDKLYLRLAGLVTLGQHHHVAAPALVLLVHERHELHVCVLEAGSSSTEERGETKNKMKTKMTS